MFVCRKRTASAAVAAGALVLWTLSCGGGGDSPSTATPPTTVAPRPSPTPGPGSSAGFHDTACPLGKGEPEASCYNRHNTYLVNDIETAMETLVAQKPQIFDLNDQFPPGSGGYKILDREAFMEGLVANLRAMGLCAERDPDDAFQQTIRAKNTNDFSEDFEVMLPTGYMRLGRGMYAQTCRPAGFPVDREASAPPIGSGCGRPYPPTITRFQCKVQTANWQYAVLDATPMVGPDPYYCGLIGFTDGRTICPVRPEGAADRNACENWRVGKAKDTGRLGPTWTKGDGTYCTGTDSGCENVPENQYQLVAYRTGTYVVTAENGASCTVRY